MSKCDPPPCQSFGCRATALRLRTSPIFFPLICSTLTGRLSGESEYLVMKPNLEKYRRHVDPFNLSEEQKTELLTAIWHIVEGFADRAFGHDSHTLLDASGGKIADDDGKLIDLDGQLLRGRFNAASRGEAK